VAVGGKIGGEQEKEKKEKKKKAPKAKKPKAVKAAVHHDDLHEQTQSARSGKITSSIEQENMPVRFIDRKNLRNSIPASQLLSYASDNSNANVRDSIVSFGLQSVHNYDEEIITKLQRDNHLLKTEAFVINTLHTLDNSKFVSK
jgi:hypothetical protein